MLVFNFEYAVNILYKYTTSGRKNLLDNFNTISPGHFWTPVVFYVINIVIKGSNFISCLSQTFPREINTLF